MKYLIVLFAMLASTVAIADDAADRANAIEWIRLQLQDQKIKTVTGRTLDGQPCRLTLSDWLEPLGTYRVAVGPPIDDQANHRNEFVGINTCEAESIGVEGSLVTFNSNHPWGNDSKWNTVVVKLRPDGSVLRATGNSDIKKIICILDAQK